jgi:hypothetical protein
LRTEANQSPNPSKPMSKPTCQGVGVSGDGAHNDDPGLGLPVLLQVLQQQVDQQEVTQVVSPDAQLETLGRKPAHERRVVKGVVKMHDKRVVKGVVQ